VFFFLNKFNGFGGGGGPTGAGGVVVTLAESFLIESFFAFLFFFLNGLILLNTSTGDGGGGGGVGGVCEKALDPKIVSAVLNAITKRYLFFIIISLQPVLGVIRYQVYYKAVISSVWFFPKVQKNN